MRSSVSNFLNNNVELLKKVGPTLVESAKKVNLNEYANKFSKVVEQATDFAGDIHENLKNNVGVSRYGNTTYGSYSRPEEGFKIPRPDKTVRDAIRDRAGFD